MGDLVAECDRLRRRITRRKRVLRHLRAALGSDAARLHQLEAQCRALGVGFYTVPVTTGDAAPPPPQGEEETHGRPPA